jgi:hypothetical protein
VPSFCLTAASSGSLILTRPQPGIATCPTCAPSLLRASGIGPGPVMCLFHQIGLTSPIATPVGMTPFGRPVPISIDLSRPAGRTCHASDLLDAQSPLGFIAGQHPLSHSRNGDSISCFGCGTHGRDPGPLFFPSYYEEKSAWPVPRAARAAILLVAYRFYHNDRRLSTEKGPKSRERVFSPQKSSSHECPIPKGQLKAGLVRADLPRWASPATPGDPSIPVQVAFLPTMPGLPTHSGRPP